VNKKNALVLKEDDLRRAEEDKKLLELAEHIGRGFREILGKPADGEFFFLFFFSFLFSHLWILFLLFWFQSGPPMTTSKKNGSFNSGLTLSTSAICWSSMKRFKERPAWESPKSGFFNKSPSRF